MNLYDRLKNNDHLSEQEEDEVFGVLIRRYEEDQLKLKWAGILEKKHGLVRPKEDSVIVPITRPRWLWMGLLAACLVGLLFVGLNLWSTPNGEQLIAEQIEQVQLINLRSSTSSQGTRNDERNEFVTAFQNQNWAEALSVGNQLLDQDIVPSNDLLHVAFVHLQLASYEEAEKLLEKLLKRNDLLSVEARYYLGVAQLAAGKVNAGESTLEEIGPDAGDKYHQLAQQLLSASYPQD